MNPRFCTLVTGGMQIYLTAVVPTEVFLGFPCGSAQLVKNPPAIWETWVWSLGWEDPLEKGKATYSSILAWRIPWTVQSMGSQRVRHNWAAFTFSGPQLWIYRGCISWCAWIPLKTTCIRISRDGLERQYFFKVPEMVPLCSQGGWFLI